MQLVFLTKNTKCCTFAWLSRFPFKTFVLWGPLYFKFTRFKDLNPRLNLNVLNFKKVEFWGIDNKLNINTIKKPA